MSRVLLVCLFVLAFEWPLAARASPTEPLRIGALFSLSSWGAQGGQSELNGALLAVEDINAKGGVEGRPIELVIEDNQSDLKSSASGFRRLASAKDVVAVIGPNWTEFIDVVAPLAVAEGLPVVTPSGYKERHVRPDPWVFVLWPPPHVVTTLLADAMVKRGMSKVSVLISENAYYQGMLAALRPQLSARQISIVEELSFAPGSSDYRSAILKLTKNGSQGVVTFLLESGEFASFLKQRREQKFGLPLFGANTIPFDPIVQKNLALAEGLVYFDYVALGTPEFHQRYESKFKTPPGFGSAKAYDGMFLIAQAVRECGATRSKVRDCLRKSTLQGVSGSIEFDQHGVLADKTPNAKLFSVSDGRIVEVVS